MNTQPLQRVFLRGRQVLADVARFLPAVFADPDEGDIALALDMNNMLLPIDLNNRILGSMLLWQVAT